MCVCVYTRVLGSDLFEVAGRVIAHGFILTGLWPYHLCQASIVVALTGSVSPSLAINSFMEFIAPEDQPYLQQLLNPATYSVVSDLTRLRILSQYDCRVNVTADTVQGVVQQLAHLHTVYIPFSPLLQLARGLCAYPSFWSRVSQDTLTELYKSLLPNADKVLAALSVDHSDNIDCRFMEERVVTYLTTFLSSIANEDLQRVLIFWTASNTLCDEPLKVAFNSCQGLSRRPTAMTCSATLTLSRYYVSQDDFNTDVRAMLTDDARIFDTL